MKHRISAFCITLLVLLALAAPVFAQQATPAEFNLRSHRDFGYGAGADVRGNFSFTISGPADKIQSVTYLIDGQEMATVDQPPFKFAYKTTDYPDGWHKFAARVTTTSGQPVMTPEISLNFVSNTQQSEGMKQILLPLLGVIAVIMIISYGGQFLMMRRNKQLMPGSTRVYGLKGGAICPNCGRPFAIHTMSINLIGSVFDRCDYCGKWSVVRRRSPAELAAAEAAERAAVASSESSLPGAQTNETEEDRLRRMLDDSKYTQ